MTINSTSKRDEQYMNKLKEYGQSDLIHCIERKFNLKGEEVLILTSTHHLNDVDSSSASILLDLLNNPLKDRVYLNCDFSELDSMMDFEVSEDYSSTDSVYINPNQI